MNNNQKSAQFPQISAVLLKYEFIDIVLTFKKHINRTLINYQYRYTLIEHQTYLFYCKQVSQISLYVCVHTLSKVFIFSDKKDDITNNGQFSGKYSLSYILISIFISILIENQVISFTMIIPCKNNAFLYKGLLFGSSLGGALLISLAIIGGCVLFKYNRVRTKYNKCCNCTHF